MVGTSWYCVKCDRLHDYKASNCLDCGHDWMAVTKREVWTALASENMGLARSAAGWWAKKWPWVYVRKMGGFEELYAVGLWALVRASQLFDPAKGWKFSTYAYPSVLARIKQFIDAQYNQKRKGQFKEIYLIEWNKGCGHNSPHGSFADLIPERVDYWGPVIDQADDIRKAARETLSLRDLFCFNEVFEKGRTFEDLGIELGVSKERIRQLVERALYKVRFAMNPTHKEVEEYEVEQERKRAWYRKKGA